MVSLELMRTCSVSLMQSSAQKSWIWKRGSHERNKLEPLVWSVCVTNAEEMHDKEPLLSAALWLSFMASVFPERDVNISAATERKHGFFICAVNLRGICLPLQIRDQQTTVMFVCLYKWARKHFWHETQDHNLTKKKPQTVVEEMFWSFA